MESRALFRLHDEDSVAIARSELAPGTVVELDGSRLRVADAIPPGHKVALLDIPQGAPVCKYGQTIGLATRAIAAGEHVHEHNLRSDPQRALSGDSHHASGANPPAAAGPVLDGPSFEGFLRAGGRAGTRNYVAIVSSVNCSATVARRIAAAFTRPGRLDAHPTVDGVVALTHSTGCGMVHDGEGLRLLRRTLAGYAQHPNVAAVLLIGLGCEVNQISELTESLAPDIDRPLARLVIQDEGGSVAAANRGIELVEELVAAAGEAQRVPIPASELILGLNCGGSDAWSGVTANPVLGHAADRLVACGGAAILGETPEIYGAEKLLLSRAASPEVERALLERLAWWQRYATTGGGSLDSNPSPGNRAGGVTTIEEKSLGAIAKGGTSPLRAVYEYAQRVDQRGLVFMDTPGYDPVSVTGIVAGGANVVCFTTGRGSVFGSKPTPSLKLSSTTDLYRRMTDDIDFNCGPVLDGDATTAELGDALFGEILAVASGRMTRSEELGFGDEEFTPWQVGAVM